VLSPRRRKGWGIGWSGCDVDDRRSDVLDSFVHKQSTLSNLSSADTKVASVDLTLESRQDPV